MRGGEGFEQQRTFINGIRAFTSSIPKILLKVSLQNSRNLGEKSTSCKSYPEVPLWCFLLNFLQDHVLREFKEGVVGIRRSFFVNHLFQPQFPRRGTVRKPVMIPCQGNLQGVFTEEYASTLTTM